MDIYLPTPTVFTSTYETVEFSLVCTDVHNTFVNYVYMANTLNILNIVLLVLFALFTVRWIQYRIRRQESL